MEESKNKAENKSGALPVPPWKVQKERKLDIKPEKEDEKDIKEKTTTSQDGSSSSKKLKRIGVLSFAKTYAVMGLVMGLVIALVWGSIILIAGSLATETSSFEAFENDLIQTYGIVVIAAIPVLYAVMGFMGGVIAAIGFNIVMKITGGIELEFED